MFRVEVEDKELLAKVRKAKQEVYRKVMGELLIGAKEIQTDAREIVPVDTGALRRSIKHRRVEDGFAIGTNQVYAAPVEKKKPYLRPAFYNNYQRINKLVLAIIRKLL